jgi:P-type Mg2+ transporter
MEQKTQAFWAVSPADLLKGLKTTANGLSAPEARARLAQYGPNVLKRAKRTDSLALLANQFRSPIILILVFAAVLSFFLGDPVDAVIIISIVAISGLLGFWQERGAASAVEKLLELVEVKASVRRAGQEIEIPSDEVVPGDIVLLAAGDSVPGDSLIIESKDLFVDEAALTGESYPAEKSTGVLQADTPLAGRTNSLFMGTHVISGTATTVVVRTGTATEFGSISEHLRLRPPETEFEHGVRRFGFFLLEITLILILGIFAVNVYLHRPVLDSFLFSLALAVGLTPQLLPAIISVNLAHGAQRMAKEKVIVKRLVAIENFGSMNVLCSDKTGTLTEGIVHLSGAFNSAGEPDDKVLLYAYLNSAYETGLASPIDEAIKNFKHFDIAGFEKHDEIPYDFIRKRVSIVVGHEGHNLIITKGALENVLAVCTLVEKPDGSVVELDGFKERLHDIFEEYSAQGYRTLGVAYRDLGSDPIINKDDEAGMTFLGFLTFADPPKPGVMETINRLRENGVVLKIITGDNRLIARTISEQVGMKNPQILGGEELHSLSDEALIRRVADIDVFAEVEPNHKEKILVALRKLGNVVGYLGDGINDASALHAADVGISVNTAVDVAKEAADIVLLEKDLAVLEHGVIEGRITFANTIKYVFMATSANFGNMFSMAGASLFLPFLPLLPGQILLTNLLTDFPEMTIATDRVDAEFVKGPHRWDIGFIRNFMIVFGPVSSIFDYATFGVLLLVLNANVTQFRTGWFMESVISASMIVLVIRTRHPFFRSVPGRLLSLATLVVAAVTLAIPYSPLGPVLGFAPLPVEFLALLVVILTVYILVAEVAKRMFYKRVKF